MGGFGLKAHDDRFAPECQAIFGKKSSRIRIRFRINDIRVEEPPTEDSLYTEFTNEASGRPETRATPKRTHPAAGGMNRTGVSLRNGCRAR